MSPSPAPPMIGRRTVIGGALAAAVPGWMSGCASIGGPITGSAERLAAWRAVNRIGWGAAPQTMQAVWQTGYERHVAQQLAADAKAPMADAVQAQIDMLKIQRTALLPLLVEVEAARKQGDELPTEDERKAAQQRYQQTLNQLSREAATRHLLRAVHSEHQLLEHMTWFWVNHFNVHQYKANVRAMLGDYEERALRPHALGRFRDLLGAVCRHPAMLRYLDNFQNAARRINENHARELLELHTLGVHGGYQQRDVQELARVLTGFGINQGADPNERPAKLPPQTADQYRRDGAFEFHPARHDYGDKQLLGRTIKGRGEAELDEVLDVLAVHPSTARFVSTRIATFLLADEPPTELVERMAQAWIKSDGRIDASVRVLLLSPEFRAESVTHAKFKDPMHFVVSAVRAGYEDRVVINTNPMQGWLFRMGQGLYNRQTPDGYPLTAAAWTSSGQLGTRFEIARTLGSGNVALFRTDETVRGAPPVLPQLDNALYRETLQATLKPATRAAFAQAASPTEWNALYLSSPEFMYR